MEAPTDAYEDSGDESIMSSLRDTVRDKLRRASHDLFIDESEIESLSSDFPFDDGGETSEDERDYRMWKAYHSER